MHSFRRLFRMIFLALYCIWRHPTPNTIIYDWIGYVLLLVTNVTLNFYEYSFVLRDFNVWSVYTKFIATIFCDRFLRSSYFAELVVFAVEFVSSKLNNGKKIIQNYTWMCVEANADNRYDGQVNGDFIGLVTRVCHWCHYTNTHYLSSMFRALIYWKRI